jgi:hypothetical protein
MVIRNTFIAIGLLVGSYLVAALVNASPITQQPFRPSGRVRVIVIVPRFDAPAGSEADAPAVPASIPQQSL